MVADSNLYTSYSNKFFKLSLKAIAARVNEETELAKLIIFL